MGVRPQFGPDVKSGRLQRHVVSGLLCRSAGHVNKWQHSTLTQSHGSMHCILPSSPAGWMGKHTEFYCSEMPMIYPERSQTAERYSMLKLVVIIIDCNNIHQSMSWLVSNRYNDPWFLTTFLWHINSSMHDYLEEYGTSYCIIQLVY